VGLVLPAAMAASPLTIVEIIRNGISGLPPVLSANHMVTPTNTSPASTPPTAPRNSRAASGSSTCLRCIATTGITSGWELA
jgi:hypothetical protein